MGTHHFVQRARAIRRTAGRAHTDRAWRSLAGIHAVTAVNAFGGAAYALGGAEGVPLEWLDGTPFDGYVVPGLILGGVVGGSLLVAATSLWRGRPSAPRLSAAAGVVLLGWIATQVAMIGYVSPLQPIVFGVGLLILWLTRRLPA
jgi:hypothetical protein